MFGKFGITPTNAFPSGANNPMFGKFGITPANAMTINGYSLDNVLVRSFTSQVAAFANRVNIRTTFTCILNVV